MGSRGVWHIAWTSLRARDAQIVLVVGLALAVVDASAWVGHAGALGSFLLDQGRTTFGRGTALVLGAVVGGRIADVGATIHATGRSRRAALSDLALFGAALGAVLAVLFDVVSLAFGLVDTLVQDRVIRLGSPIPVPARLVFEGELRVVATFAALATFGALIGWAAGRPAIAVVVASAAFVPYLPVLTLITNRAPALVNGLPYLPFGAVQGVVGGNGGLVAVGDEGRAAIDPHRAVLVATAWLALVAAIAWTRSERVATARSRWASGAWAIPSGVALAALAGVALPPLVAASVPWPFRPAWRRADDAGWSSRRVALRWVAAVRAGSSTGLRELFLPGVSLPETASVAPLREPGAVSISPISRMADPFHVTVVLAFRPPVHRPGIVVGKAAYVLHFALVNGHYLIAGVDGPYVQARRA